MAKTQQRPLPTLTDNVTHEVIHPSVLNQIAPIPELSNVLKEHPELLHNLLPWEEQVKEAWGAQLATTSAFRVQAAAAHTTDTSHHSHDFIHKTVEAIKRLKHSERSDGVAQPETHTAYVNGWLGKVATESSIGVVVQELLKK